MRGEQKLGRVADRAERLLRRIRTTTNVVIPAAKAGTYFSHGYRPSPV